MAAVNQPPQNGFQFEPPRKEEVEIEKELDYSFFSP
jgi:hypothetical protein